MPVEKMSKEDIIRNLQDIYSAEKWLETNIYSAEKWLETNIMQPYWTSEEVHHNSSSRFSAANLAKLW